MAQDLSSFLSLDSEFKLLSFVVVVVVDDDVVVVVLMLTMQQCWKL